MSNPSPVVIRPLVAADESFLWEALYHAIYVGSGPPPARDIVHQPDMAAYVEDWGRSDDSGFLAFDSTTIQPLGAVWVRRWTGVHKGYGYIDDATPELSIALLPECRGRGIGTQLLEAMLEAARTRYTALSLSVSPENPARRLYERLGFVVVGQHGPALTMQIVFAPDQLA